MTHLICVRVSHSHTRRKSAGAPYTKNAGWLAVFQGGFQRAAAGHIVGASLPLLATLVSKSLVRRTESGRYDLHKVIRQYAQWHLAEDSTRETALRNRRAEYDLEKLCCRENDMKNAALRETLRELTDEIDNLCAAWVWAVAHEKIATLADSVMALGRLFELEGWLREGIEQIEPVVQALQRRTADAEQNRLLGKALGRQEVLHNARAGRYEQNERPLASFVQSDVQNLADQYKKR